MQMLGRSLIFLKDQGKGKCWFQEFQRSNKRIIQIMQVKRQIKKAVRSQKFCAQIVKGVKGSEPIKNTMPKMVFDQCGPCLTYSLSCYVNKTKRLNVLSVEQRIEAINEVIKAEKQINDTEADNKNMFIKTLTPQQPVNALSIAGLEEAHGWHLLFIIVDSGAAETVIQHNLIKGYKMQETAESKAGVCYASATGDPIPNLG